MCLGSFAFTLGDFSTSKGLIEFLHTLKYIGLNMYLLSYVLWKHILGEKMSDSWRNHHLKVYMMLVNFKQMLHFLS